MRPPTGEPNLPQAAGALDDGRPHRILEDREFEQTEILTVQSEPVPVSRERRETDEAEPSLGIELMHPPLLGTNPIQ